MKKTIAIIGAAGKMGSGLTRNLSKSGYRLLIVGSNQSKLKELITSIKSSTPKADIEIKNSAKEASREADIIIPAVKYKMESSIIDEIREAAVGKIVISIANPLNDTYDGLVTNPNTSAAEELAKLLPHSKIVKAFNTVFAADFITPNLSGNIVDCFIAGNDEEAVAEITELVKDACFNPLNAGKLSVSRTLENMMVLLIGLNMKYNFNWSAGWKILYQEA